MAITGSGISSSGLASGGAVKGSPSTGGLVGSGVSGSVSGSALTTPTPIAVLPTGAVTATGGASQTVQPPIQQVPAPPNRKGLNGSFSYTLPNSNKAQVYQVRVLGFGYGSQQIASETMSRTRRAFYPRNVVSTTFYAQILIVGVAERASFANYIQNYANNYLAPSASFPPIMTFTCTSANISQTGIPTDGFEWGNAVGSIMWTPTISIQPTDPSFTPAGIQRTGGVGISSLNQAAYKSVLKIAPEVQYFIPEGIQLSGDQAPPSGAWNTSDPGLTPASVDQIASGSPVPKSDPTGKGLGGK